MIYDYLYNLYLTSESLKDAGYTFTSYGYIITLSAMILRQLLFYCIFYAFRGVALYKMAKKRDIKEAYLAFIPFACYIFIGKLQARGKAVAKTRKFYLVALICSAVYLGISLITDICFAVKPMKTLIIDGNQLTESDFYRGSFALNALDMISYVAMLGYVIFTLYAYSNLFRAYTPTKVFRYNVFSLLGYVLLGSFFVTGIFLFVNRDAEYIDYDEYVESMRRKYYGAFNSGSAPSNKKTKAEDDPFAEFSAKSNDDPFSDFGNDDKNSDNNR